jgi:hypothetical protein
VQRLLGGGVVIDVLSRFGNGYRGDASGDVADRPNVTTEWQSLDDRVFLFLLPLSHAVAIQMHILVHGFFKLVRVPRGKGGHVITMRVLHQGSHFIDTIPTRITEDVLV